jgi:hypothetical protein
MMVKKHMLTTFRKHIFLCQSTPLIHQLLFLRMYSNKDGSHRSSQTRSTSIIYIVSRQRYQIYITDNEEEMVSHFSV